LQNDLTNTFCEINCKDIPIKMLLSSVLLSSLERSDSNVHQPYDEPASVQMPRGLEIHEGGIDPRPLRPPLILSEFRAGGSLRAS
jgi:hypothetical protein